MSSDAKKNCNAEGRDDLLWFDPEKLVVVEDQNHPLYDSRVNLPIDESMILDVMYRGVHTPIQVRRNGTGDDGKPIVEVVAGRQRVKACREANKRLREQGKEPYWVPARLRRGQDADMFGLLVSENTHRRNDGPVVKAQKIEKYLSLGRSQEEACVTFGLGLQMLKQYLVILDCVPEVQAAIDGSKLPVSVGKDFAAMKREDQGAALAKMLAAGVNKGAKAAAAVKKLKQGKSIDDIRPRTRGFMLRWFTLIKKNSDKITPTVNAVVAYLLGDDKALRKYQELEALAIEAGQARKSKGKPDPEPKADPEPDKSDVRKNRIEVLRERSEELARKKNVRKARSTVPVEEVNVPTIDDEPEVVRAPPRVIEEIDAEDASPPLPSKVFF
jgi:ParB family transcriptional regulator, chromosome partitioning protein